MLHVLALILTIALDPFSQLPPVSDIEFLPPIEIANWGQKEAWQAALNWQEVMKFRGLYLNSGTPPAHVLWLREAIADCGRREDCWSKLQSIHNAYSYWQMAEKNHWWTPERGYYGSPEYVRLQMAELRSMIGPELYYSGKMPAPVNTRLYREIP